MFPNNIRVNNKVLYDEKFQKFLGHKLETFEPKKLGLKAFNKKNC